MTEVDTEYLRGTDEMHLDPLPFLGVSMQSLQCVGEKNEGEIREIINLGFSEKLMAEFHRENQEQLTKGPGSSLLYVKHRDL